jgi:rhomboid protease GluP
LLEALRNTRGLFSRFRLDPVLDDCAKAFQVLLALPVHLLTTGHGGTALLFALPNWRLAQRFPVLYSRLQPPATSPTARGDFMPIPVRWRYKLDRWRNEIQGKFTSRSPSPQRPRLCPACGTLVGASATRCHQCGASMSFSLAAASNSLSKLMPHGATVTYTILGLDILIYGLSLLMTIQRSGGIDAPSGGLGGLLRTLGGIDGTILQRMGMSMPAWFAVNDFAQPWRLVMAVFLHGSLIHIGFNMMALTNIGPLVEEIYGSARYLFVFVVTGAVGFVASSIFGHASVGASGSIFGLVGLLIAFTGSRQSAGARMLRGQLISSVVGMAVLGLLMPGIDNFAHGGGFVAGYLLGRLIPDRQPADASEKRTAHVMGWAAALVVAASFILMVINYFATARVFG